MSEATSRSINKKQVARKALRELSSLTEPAMVKQQLHHWLRGDRPFVLRALWLAEEVFETSSYGGMDGRALFRAVLSSLLTLDHALMLRLMFEAKSECLELTRSTLWSALIPSKRSPAEENLPTTDDHGRALTLGERRSLARKPSPKSIEKLLSDRDPIVLEHLLNNPRLTEVLLLRVVTYRAQVPHNLFRVFDHPEWGQRQPIQRAIALNPSSPLALRCALISSCTSEDHEMILRESHLSSPLRASINRYRQNLEI